MRISALKTNDIVDSDDGFAVSLWFQGCKRNCKGCQNSQTWDLNGGDFVDNDRIIKRILYHLNKNGINRCLSVLGGEPLIPENRADAWYIINSVKEKSPQTKVYVWTGYTIEDLKKENDIYLNRILDLVDYLIDGQFVLALRDITLKLRGSSNQRIFKRNDLGELVDVTPPLTEIQEKKLEKSKKNK